MSAFQVPPEVDGNGALRDADEIELAEELAVGSRSPWTTRIVTAFWLPSRSAQVTGESCACSPAQRKS
ncbi:hypothetical protein [Bradyrhizobium sp. 6(2017)]|uniref:hypothetical protein n=1 Tax=Bradyrhizobium sp. 6(2017) TaxID=1197460 RepID=UPI0013E1AE4A|nr:hypothetical protein [Bradyrhizobium sp. 6(2017)]QIG91220.1 hypothetical protein G6P99_00930 [Bradyrhizobium sp. 6(2017)]